MARNAVATDPVYKLGLKTGGMMTGCPTSIFASTSRCPMTDRAILKTAIRHFTEGNLDA
jgi:hypothetical protein